MNKRGELLQKVVVHLVLVGLIFAIFLVAVSARVSGRDVKQQILEKEIALLVDAAEPGFSFEIWKANVDGRVDGVKFDQGRVYVEVDGLVSFGGYPYFSEYLVEVEELDDKFVVRVV